MLLAPLCLKGHSPCSLITPNGGSYMCAAQTRLQSCLKTPVFCSMQDSFWPTCIYCMMGSMHRFPSVSLSHVLDSISYYYWLQSRAIIHLVVSIHPPIWPCICSLPLVNPPLGTLMYVINKKDRIWLVCNVELPSDSFSPNMSYQNWPLNGNEILLVKWPVIFSCIWHP